MFDSWILRKNEGWINVLAGFLASRGVSPNSISILGAVVGLIAFLCICLGWFLVAIFWILLNRLLDNLDGAVARKKKASDSGAFLDISLDFFFYSLIPLGFAIYSPEDYALASAFVIFSFVCTGSSFLSFAIIAEKRKLRSHAFPKKSFYYLGGLTEASETIAFFLLSCIFPEFYATFAFIFAGLSLFTAGMRIWFGLKIFS